MFAVRSGGSSDCFEEADHGVVEQVVAVAGDHVTCTGHVDVLRVGYEFEEFLCALFAQQIARPPRTSNAGTVMRAPPLADVRDR